MTLTRHDIYENLMNTSVVNQKGTDNLLDLNGFDGREQNWNGKVQTTFNEHK
jgi:hypothetical protein